MTHVFISYVRENEAVVDRLYSDLRAHGINVWRDREAIMPGQRWQSAIRDAIRGGAYFLACFSNEYSARSRTYINEELTVAIEELRTRHLDMVWFIPIRLHECEVPPRSIGAGEDLTHLQWVDLFRNWNAGIDSLLRTFTATRHGVSLGEPQRTRWGPNDALPAGILINEGREPFVPWDHLHLEISDRLFNQLGQRIPTGCKAVLRDFYGRKDWTVVIMSEDGQELGYVWFGSNPSNGWVYDGLVRVGSAIEGGATEVWQTFERFSDGSYRRVRSGRSADRSLEGEGGRPHHDGTQDRIPKEK
ncbi:MAG: toll/interleukin-1 receptor domain-containing protein [Gammaproteobacteria bacterium]